MGWSRKGPEEAGLQKTQIAPKDQATESVIGENDIA